MAGEADYSVPPLSLPDERREPDKLLRSEAVTLFLARARAGSAAARRRRRHVLSTLARIARIWTGSRSRSSWRRLAPRRSRSRRSRTALRDRFRFLVSWRRLSPPATARSREAMDWSYELLSWEEQRAAVPGSRSSPAASRSTRPPRLPRTDDEESSRSGARPALLDASLVVAEERDDRDALPPARDGAAVRGRAAGRAG